MDAKIAEYEGLQNSIAQQRTRLEVAISESIYPKIYMSKCYLDDDHLQDLQITSETCRTVQSCSRL